MTAIQIAVAIVLAALMVIGFVRTALAMERKTRQRETDQ